MGNCCPDDSNFFTVLQISSKLAGDQDRYNLCVKFDFRPDSINNFGGTCPWAKKNAHVLIMGKCCPDYNAFIFVQSSLYL